MLAAAVAFAIPSSFLSSPASAEVHDPLRGYALDGTPVAGGPPPARAHDHPAVDGADAAPRGPAYLSFSRIRRIGERQGLRVVSLRRRGRAFFATALNPAGHTIEVTFNALNGAILDQRDVSPAVVATSPQSSPAAAAPSASGAVAPSASAKIAVVPTTSDVSAATQALAAAKAAAAQAAAAEAEARQLAAARAAEARLAQSNLAQAEVAARKAAQIKAAEDRRAQRNDAKAAEAKRRMLANAESQLAQAKAAQARIEADVKQAEAKAMAARAAMAPAEMTKTSELPVAMKPVAPPTPVAAVKSPEPQGVAAPTKTLDTPAAADVEKNPDAGVSPDAAKDEGVKDEGAKDDGKKSEATLPSGDTAGAGDTKPADATEAAKTEMPNPGASKTEAGGADKVSESKSEISGSAESATDAAPTGSTIQSPPEPYYAPTPDDAAAAVEKH